MVQRADIAVILDTRVATRRIASTCIREAGNRSSQGVEDDMTNQMMMLTLGAERSAFSASIAMHSRSHAPKVDQLPLRWFGSRAFEKQRCVGPFTLINQ
jgi:hypothetical protein